MPAGREVLSGDDRRLLDEPIRHRLAQRVVEDHVLERHRAFARFHERGSRQFQPQHGLQLVDCPDAGRRTVAVRFVHNQHEVVQAGKVIEVAFADVFGQPLDLGRFSAADF